MMCYVLAILGIIAIVGAQYNYGFDPRTTIVKRQSSSLPLTGVHNPDGTLGLRREVDDLATDPTTWNLFMLGLDMMQWTDQSDIESWYQVMGIHGRPFVPYDNVQAISPDNAQSGYCTHISILFPCWHRPYLALYEQILYKLVNSIAEFWPPGPIKDQHVAAAATFRIPYWDWAKVRANGQSVLPKTVQQPYTVVVGPNGAQNISNPLYTYYFKPLSETDFPDNPEEYWPETVRYPTTNDASAVSQNSLVAQQLDNSATAIRGRLYNVLTSYPDYAKFSNEAWIPNPNPNNYDSIESIHDTIHGLVGSGGHMSWITYSGFDPCFMLHHAMIDRVFAMWQIIHPNTAHDISFQSRTNGTKGFVTPTAARVGTFTTSMGEIQNATTPLTPFHNGETAFWTSNEVRTTQIFGYDYAETANSSATRQNVITAVNTLYGRSNTNMRRTSPQNKIHYEWLANIKVMKYALNAPFFIHAFIGPFDANPFTWSFEPNLVGTHCVFLKSSPVTAFNDLFVSATIPLTAALQDSIANGTLKSLDPSDVTPFLANEFQYRITTIDDQQVANDQVPSLTINLVSAPVQLPSRADELPVWGNVTSWADISTGN